MKRTKGKFHRLTIDLEAVEYNKLKSIALREDRLPSNLAKVIVKEYVDDHYVEDETPNKTKAS